ncbi:MAG: hypothetical protein DVB28_000447 [Verrucomicrobia bacterium]|nr:MAG: hypothetical protein DVB28_000447 [Verrucomicrobiota bacterium]
MNLSYDVAGRDGTALSPSALRFVTPASAAVAEDGSLSVQGFGYSYQPAVSASLLAGHQGPLEVCGLWEIPPDVAAAFSQHSGVLTLLTTKRTQLSDASAEALGEHHGELVLCSCCDLSDRAWAGLARHRGDIRIAGPMSLLVPGAQALATHRGFLDLPWLQRLSSEAAEALSKHRGGLSLGLFCREPRGAKGRSTARQSFLGRSQLKTLSLLAQAEGSLYLDNIQQLEVGEIEALSAVKGDLSLQGLDWNSAATAGALAKHRGHLSLSVPPSLLRTTAGALSAHQGGLSLFFDFAQIPDHLETLILAASGGNLRLSGFKNLSKQQAHSLAAHRGALELLDCFYLSQTAAQALAQHRFALSLHLDHLSPQAAKELLSHPGPLALDIDGDLSGATAHLLAQFSGKLTCTPKVMARITKFANGVDEQPGARVIRYPAGYNDCAGGCSCSSREALRRVI